MIAVIFFELNSKIIMNLFVRNIQYHDAYCIMGIIAFSFSMQVLITLLTAPLYSNKNTIAIFLSYLAGSLLNTVLNFLLIPSAGLLGAATSTGISYLVVVTCMSYLNYKIAQFPFIDRRLPYSIGGFILTWIGIVFLREYLGQYQIIFVNIPLFITIGLFLYFCILKKKKENICIRDIENSILKRSYHGEDNNYWRRPCGSKRWLSCRKRNIDYEIYEKENRVGGLCRTVEKDGFCFDYSGHLLHLKDPYFQSFVKDLLGDNMNIIERNAFIYSNGVFTRYPFQANLYGLHPEVIKECLIEFVRAYYENEDMPTRSYRSFHEWIVAKLGKGIGRHFMFPYNEKLWTVPTEELTCEWMSEYVPKPGLEDVFNGTFFDQKKGFGYNAVFWYPKKVEFRRSAIHLPERFKM